MMKPNLDSVSLFRAKNRVVADAATAILEAEKPMTLRQLFYRLVSAGEIRNKQTEYKRLGSIMTRLREARLGVASMARPSAWWEHAWYPGHLPHASV